LALRLSEGLGRSRRGSPLANLNCGKVCIDARPSTVEDILTADIARRKCATSFDLRESDLYVRVGLLEALVKVGFGFVEFNEH